MKLYVISFTNVLRVANVKVLSTALSLIVSTNDFMILVLKVRFMPLPSHFLAYQYFLFCVLVRKNI